MLCTIFTVWLTYYAFWVNGKLIWSCSNWLESFLKKKRNKENKLKKVSVKGERVLFIKYWTNTENCSWISNCRDSRSMNSFFFKTKTVIFRVERKYRDVVFLILRRCIFNIKKTQTTYTAQYYYLISSVEFLLSQDWCLGQ